MSAVEALYRNKRRLLPFGILLLLGVAIFLVLKASQQTQELRSRAAADNGLLTFANLTTGGTTATPTYTVTVVMNGSGQTVVGADILVTFDRAKLQLIEVTPPASRGVYQTYAPVDGSGNFDTAKVLTCANTGGTNCPASSVGKVEFGIVSFNWSNNTLTSPNPSSSVVLNVAQLKFQRVAGATGTTQLAFKNDGITATTDSNIVVIPTGGGDPEDILSAPGYTGSTVNVVLSATASATPAATPVASASPVPSATPTSCLYDFYPTAGGDRVINTFDVQMVGNRWNTSTGNANYNALYDIYPTSGPNGTINTFDVQLVGNRWGTSCP